MVDEIIPCNNLIKKRKFNLLDTQRFLAKNGELCNNTTTKTKSECLLGMALIEDGIQVTHDFRVDNYSFDFKVFHYPILIEVDGGYHNERWARQCDYLKDRKAQNKGFKVLRFTNREVQYDNKRKECVDTIRACISKCGLCPREIWLYPYSVLDWLKDKFRELNGKKRVWVER